jgi:hypothetical protein
VDGRARGWLAFGLGAGAVLWALGLVLAAFHVPDREVREARLSF